MGSKSERGIHKGEIQRVAVCIKQSNQIEGKKGGKRKTVTGREMSGGTKPKSTVT